MPIPGSDPAIAATAPDEPLVRKALPRLYVSGAVLAPAERVTLGGADHHYLTRVLRLGVGAPLLLLDGAGLVALAQIASLTDAQVVLVCQRCEPSGTSTPLSLTLLCGVLKGDRHDWVIEKATELGVSTIRSVLCARSVPDLSGDRSEKRQARWERVARAAMQQCRRPCLPHIAAPVPLAQALALVQAPRRLLLWEGTAQSLRSHFPDHDRHTETALLVGPEGSLTEEEIHLATQAGFLPASLGPTILRAETAAVAAIAATQVLAW